MQVLSLIIDILRGWHGTFIVLNRGRVSHAADLSLHQPSGSVQIIVVSPVDMFTSL